MVDEKEKAIMDRTLDRIFAETDRDYRELRPTDEEWQWAGTKHQKFMDRIKEIEDTLSYEMGGPKFIDLLDRWQRNIRWVLKQIRERRVDPFSGAT